MVEALEVLRHELAGALGGDVDAVAAGLGHGALVGAVADVVGARPGRVDRPAEAPAVGGELEEPVRQWRAADVPEADG